jgi:hypothetical protein
LKLRTNRSKKWSSHWKEDDDSIASSNHLSLLWWFELDWFSMSEFITKINYHLHVFGTMRTLLLLLLRIILCPASWIFLRLVFSLSTLLLCTDFAFQAKCSSLEQYCYAFSFYQLEWFYLQLKSKLYTKYHCWIEVLFMSIISIVTMHTLSYLNMMCR